MNRHNFLSIFAVLIIGLASFSLFIGKSSLAGKYDGLFTALQAMGFFPVASTGQTDSSKPRDDGDLQIGIRPLTPRYIDNGDGTVTDSFTNLMWVQDALFFGAMTWDMAIDECNNLVLADYDDWRMPNVREMLSIIDYGYNTPSLTPGHPFINIPPYPGTYWTSTGYSANNDVFHVPIVNGTVNHVSKGGSKYVWPVRGGN